MNRINRLCSLRALPGRWEPPSRRALHPGWTSLAIAAAVVMLMAGQLSAQSAWTRKKHSGFTRFGISTLNTSSFYTPLGKRLNSARYSDVTASFYGEYGLSDNLTAMLYFPFLRHHSLATTDSVTRPGDAIVGFKYRFLRGATPLAVAVDFGVPTGESQGSVAIKGVPDGVFRLPTGDGEFNTRLSLYASRSFRDGKNFLSGGGGYNIRSRGYTDEVSYFVNAGNRLLPSLWVTGAVMGLFPAGDPDLERAVGFGVGEGVQYVSLGGEVQYSFTARNSVSFGYYRPFRGKNVLAGGGFVFGVSREF
ncbi:MAG: hypothetical protein AB1898_27930 [Acidobacteriota bacterium]